MADSNVSNAGSERFRVGRALNTLCGQSLLLKEAASVLSAAVVSAFVSAAVVSGAFVSAAVVAAAVVWAAVVSSFAPLPQAVMDNTIETPRTAHNILFFMFFTTSSLFCFIP